jgi:hypothetical protein
MRRWGVVGAAVVAAGCAFDASSAGLSAGLGPSETATTSGTGSIDASATAIEPSSSVSGNDPSDTHDAATVTGAASESDTGPAPGGWMARRELTIAVDELELRGTLRDVPVLVVLGDERIDYAKTRADGQDLRFRDVDGTVLPHEIERWDAVGRSYVWVRLPSVEPDAGATIHMDYGNPDAADEQDPQGVWSDGFVGVWHVGGCDAGSMLDSSGNGLHAACMNVDEANMVEGMAGSAVRFVADDQRLVVSHDDVLGFDEALTIEAYVNLDVQTIAAQQNRFAVRKPGSYALLATGVGGGPSRGPRFNVQVGNSLEMAAAESLEPGWHALAGTVRENETLRLFVDGRVVASEQWPDDGQPAQGQENLWLGQELGGVLDEVRVSAGARSGDWLTFQAASMRDQLIAFGAEGAP